MSKRKSKRQIRKEYLNSLPWEERMMYDLKRDQAITLIILGIVMVIMGSMMLWNLAPLLILG